MIQLTPIHFLFWKLVCLGGFINIKRLFPLLVFLVNSGKNRIALEIIRSAEGRAIARLSADGKSFGDPQEFILLGATKGQQQGSLSLVEMGVIRTGQKLELGLSNLQASNRLHTLQINRIEISEYR